MPGSRQAKHPPCESSKPHLFSFRRSRDQEIKGKSKTSTHQCKEAPVTQNTPKQIPLKHIFGKERGHGKTWIPSTLVAVQPQLWAEGPGLLLAAPSARPHNSCRQASLWKEFHIFHKLYGNQEFPLGTSREGVWGLGWRRMKRHKDMVPAKENRTRMGRGSQTTDRPDHNICSNSSLLNITKYSAYIFTL